jgi:hypothetical protein
LSLLSRDRIRDFKDQIKDYNRELRKVKSAQTARDARERILANMERRNAENSAFHEKLLRRIVNNR